MRKMIKYKAERSDVKKDANAETLNLSRFSKISYGGTKPTDLKFTHEVN